MTRSSCTRTAILGSQPQPPSRRFSSRAFSSRWRTPYRSACIIGSGAGGLTTFETAYRDLFIHNKRATNPLTLLRIIGSSASAHVGIEYGIKGLTFATCSACSTATHAFGIARDYIQNGPASTWPSPAPPRPSSTTAP